MAIDFEKRNEQFSRLSISQVDNNWTKAENAINDGTDMFTTIQVACSDLTSDLAAGLKVAYFRMPYGMTLSEVRASVLTNSTGANIEVNVEKNGTTIFSTNLTIDAGENTSTPATTPAVISDPDLADDDLITIDIVQVGSTVAGQGLIVTLIGNIV